jgi:hypothetical protein
MNADKYSPLPHLLERALTSEEAEIIHYLKNTATRLVRPSSSLRQRLRQSPTIRKAWSKRRWSAAASMRAVAEYGRPYVGIPRPKQYRKRKAKTCFYSAGHLALKERGTYVEGYASCDGRSPIHPLGSRSTASMRLIRFGTIQPTAITSASPSRKK